MTTAYSWKTHDIDTLRKHFLKGLPIKCIATAMDRTPASVNKALSRFHIRTPRTLKTPHIIKDPHPTRKKRVTSPHADHPHKHKGLNWAKFEAVLRWMKHNNIAYIQSSSHTFFVEHKPCSPAQIVMYANKKRLERGEDIFFVEDITW